MIRLNQLEFSGFKNPNKVVQVKFSDAPVSVIYGNNGSGKTSFLRAISAFLSQDETALLALGVRRIDCTYTSNDGTISTVTVERAQISYNWQEFSDSPLKDTSSISLGVERGISNLSSKIEPGLIYDFCKRSTRTRALFNKASDFLVHEFSESLSAFLMRSQNASRDRSGDLDEARGGHQNIQNIKLEHIEQLLLNHYSRARFSANLKIQSALFTTLVNAINNDTAKISRPAQVLQASILEYRSRLIEALSTEGGSESNHYKETIVKILSSLTPETYLSEMERKPLLSALFANMIDELDREKLALSSINLLVDTFNKYLIDNKKLVVAHDEIYVEIDGDHHSVHELSSGERHILTFLSIVVLLGQDRDFLIVDEPEISLNITWQRQLLELFAQLVPKTQIIVASHSPVLSKRRPEFLTPLTTFVRSV